MKSLSVIIPNYNGKHLFEKYLDHNIRIIKSLPNETEIIIVDDASKDDSISYLREKYTNEIIVIAKEHNSGFSKTCNEGIKKAKYDLILLLNTDVLITENYFDNLFKYFDKEDTFGVMGRIIGMNDDVIQDAARLPIMVGRKIKPSNFYYLQDQEVFTPTLYLSGAVALIDAKKLKILNGFNELFSPFYGEDFELSIRAWRLGWKSYYHHEAICRHEISGTTKNSQKKYWIKKIYFRNRFFLHFLHLNGINLFIWHLQAIFTNVIPSLFTFKSFKLKAYKEVWKQRNKLIESKKEFNQLMQREHTETSLLSVMTNINEMLTGKKIIKL